MFEDLTRDWDGEDVLIREDDAPGTWMFIGVHSTALGPAMGGTRMKVYDEPAEGLRDVLRLSGAMTLKNAAAGLPFGGGKAVLAVPRIPEGQERRELLERYADTITSLDGRYLTACDMNTTEADMDVIGERCPHVLGRSKQAGGSGSSAPATAVGVFRGILAGLERVFGSDELHGRTVVVQGAGAVGARLCELLVGAGARVSVSDTAAGRVEELVKGLGVGALPIEETLSAECDVLSPCATGGVLNETSIPELRCRVIAGAANNQLATEEDGMRLQQAGVLYAPDFVVNAGGVLSLAGLERLDWSEQQLAARLAAIGDTLAEVFFTAEADGISSEEAARRLARSKISTARA
jgi:leucine dehydrogenase